MLKITDLKKKIKDLSTTIFIDLNNFRLSFNDKDSNNNYYYKNYYISYNYYKNTPLINVSNTT